MKSRASALGHAIHPMLIVFPFGLLPTAVIFDVIFLVTDGAGFATAAAYLIAAGVLGGLIAAVPGIVDWAAIPRSTRARRLGALHGILNGVMITLFAISLLLRAGEVGWQPGAAALVFSFAGVALAPFSGWLGGELVERLGVGVDDGAHVDAPSSLRQETP